MAISLLDNIKIFVPDIDYTTGTLLNSNTVYTSENRYQANNIINNYYNNESAVLVRGKHNKVKNYLKHADDYLAALSNFILDNSNDKSIVSKLNETINVLNNTTTNTIPALQKNIAEVQSSIKEQILEILSTINTDIKNKLWLSIPKVPYYKEDVWLVESDVLVDNILFKGGIAYICTNTCLSGNFKNTDWQPMSIFNYEQLVNLPKINNKTLKGNINVVTPDQIKNFVYSKTYNNIDSDITNITYDNSLECLKVLSTDTVTIAVPEEHVYTVTFDVQLLQNANTKLYIIDNKGTEIENSVVVGKNDIVVTSDKIKFRVNDTMWIKNITVTGLDIEIPKKVSQLENDLKYNHLDVSEPETIVVNIPNKL